MPDVPPISNANSAPRATGFSALGADDFSKIIFAELSKQDPLQPNDTNALLQQLSTLRSIQSGMDLSSKLSEVVRQNEFSSAATLVGKFVSGVDETGERSQGQVRSVAKSSDGVVVELLTGQRISMSNLDLIQSEPPSTEQEETP